MSDATTINGWLEGSPYLVPTDASGEALASLLLEEQLKVHTRHRDVLAVFLDRTDVVRREIEHDFDVRLVHESNAIEGAGTTFEETREIFRHPIDQATSAVSFSMGIEADPKLLEVLGHRTALRFVRELTTNLQFGQLREVDIRNIHRLTMQAEPRIAGHYKTTDNVISGRNPHYLTARAEDVSLHVAQLVAWMNTCQIHGPLAAAVVGAWLADIHPFEDGNGRVSRLVVNYGLLRSNWPCLIIRSGADRQRYYEALAASDAGDISALFSLNLDGLNRTLTELEDPDLTRSLVEHDLERQQRYASWTRVHHVFAAELRDALNQRGIELSVVGSLTETDFEWLVRRDPAGNGWWAKVKGANSDLLLWFGYQSDQIRSELHEPATPSVFISERDRSPASIHPYAPLWRDERLTISELSLIPSSRRRRAVIRRRESVEVLSVKDAVDHFARALFEFCEHSAAANFDDPGPSA